MDVSNFIDNAQNLSDLELATLLCLIAKEHCLFETADELVDDLASELALIVSEIFGLSYAMLSMEDLDSIDVFGEAILEQNDVVSTDIKPPISGTNDQKFPLGSQPADSSVRTASIVPSSDMRLDIRKVVNVLIIKDLNLACHDVQVQTMELVRRHRIFSRTTVHAVSEVFLMMGIVSTSNKDVKLSKHLNDRIFISHYHDSEDGFPNLEVNDRSYVSDDHSSTTSVVRKSNSRPTEGSSSDRQIDMQIVGELREMGRAVTITSEIRRYLQDIVTFTRLERGVAGGVSPYATVLFEGLAKYLAPLHGLDFVTPSLIALAAKKIYRHRIKIASPEKERSMQYGSDIAAVQEMLEGLTAETVIETVLEKVECLM